jgi:hypothetical protein
MADISADTILPSGVFVPTAYNIGSIASGVTGTLLTITAPAGKKVRLNGLSASGTQAGISVVVDGATVVATTDLQSTAGNSGFIVGLAPGTSGVNVIQYLQGYSTISIVKNAGSTAATIYYSHVYGD